MVFQNITLNLTAIGDITPFNISINESSLGEVVNVANSSSNNFIIFGSLFAILIIIYVALSDKTQFQNFGYGDVRAISLALASCVLIGLTMVSIGWSPNFKAVGMFITMWVLSLILIYLIENKE